MKIEKLEDKKLNLPKTNFPMRSGLPNLEKRIIELWDKTNVRELIYSKRDKEKKFVLHFGPPYSNGDLHLGHGLSYILKDLIIRSKSMLGFNINNLTGHDCHGLPIELATKKQLKEPSKSIKEFVSECNKFSRKFIELQQNSFKRMGILKEKEYYTTIDSIPERYKTFSDLLMKGYVYVDHKTCAWSITERTVISDAEIVYRTKKSKSVDLALEITDSKIENLKGAFVCVWTTTPWTLIDNVAVAFNKEINYLLCEMEDKMIIIAQEVYDSFRQRVGEDLNVLGVFSGDVFEGIKCKHPILDYSVPLVHGDHVESSSGTGFVHISPAHGIEDFE
ncbi:MAG: class I tRNA ligase family protein, partial [Bacteroidota bacterium]